MFFQVLSSSTKFSDVVKEHRKRPMACNGLMCSYFGNCFYFAFNFYFFVCLFCFCLLYVCSIFIFFIFVNLRLFFEKKLNIIKKNRRLNRKVSWFGDFCNLDLTQTAKIKKNKTKEILQNHLFSIDWMKKNNAG